MSNLQESEIPLGDQLRHVVRAKNLLKTVASQVPFVSASVEILNQLEGQRIDARIASLEAERAVLKRQNQDATDTPTLPPAPTSARDRSAWPPAVKEYLARNVEFAVVHTPGEQFGDRYVLGVGNGCLIGDNHVLTCGEVLATAHAVAQHKRGRVGRKVKQREKCVGGDFVALPWAKAERLQNLHRFAQFSLPGCDKGAFRGHQRSALSISSSNSAWFGKASPILRPSDSSSSRFG